MTKALRAAVVVLVALALLAPGARAATAPPDVDSKAAIVMETSTGDVSYRLNDRERLPIASTTKLMTALLTLKRAKLDDAFMSPGYEGDPAESVINLKPGDMKTSSSLARLSVSSAVMSFVVEAIGRRSRSLSR